MPLSPYGGSVKNTAPLLPRTMSFGLLKRWPSKRSTSTVFCFVRGSSRARAARNPNRPAAPCPAVSVNRPLAPASRKVTLVRAKRSRKVSEEHRQGHLSPTSDRFRFFGTSVNSR